MRYFVELDGSEPGFGYDVTVPDLPGCTSAGDDLDEALQTKAIFTSRSFAGQLFHTLPCTAQELTAVPEA